MNLGTTCVAGPLLPSSEYWCNAGCNPRPPGEDMKYMSCAVLFCTVLFVTGSASAQDRMPTIPREKMTDAQKRAADELVAGRRGALEGPFVPLLRSPEFMSRLQKMGEYLRYESAIGTKLTEFLILITARQWTQQYEWDVHFPLAVKAGV